MVSNWFLYIGIFLCASGVGVVVGAIFIFYWGIKIFNKKTISNFITKIFYILIYISCGTVFLNILHNNSFWLIDNGNGGFVGQAIRENIYYFSPLIENQYHLYELLNHQFFSVLIIWCIKILVVQKRHLFFSRIA